MAGRAGNDDDADSLVTVLPESVPSVRATASLRQRVWILPPPPTGSVRGKQAARQPVLTADVDTLWFYTAAAAAATAAAVARVPHRTPKRPRQQTNEVDGAATPEASSSAVARRRVAAAAASGAMHEPSDSEDAAPGVGRKRTRRQALSPSREDAADDLADAPAGNVRVRSARPAAKAASGAMAEARDGQSSMMVARMAMLEVALRHKTSTGRMVCPRCGDIHDDAVAFRKHMLEMPCVAASRSSEVQLVTSRGMLREANRRTAEDIASGVLASPAPVARRAPLVGNSTAALEDRLALFHLAQRFKTASGACVCVRCGQSFAALDAFREHAVALPCVRESQMGDVVTVVPPTWLHDRVPRDRRAAGIGGAGLPRGRPRKAAAAADESEADAEADAEAEAEAEAEDVESLHRRGHVSTKAGAASEAAIRALLARHPAAGWPAKELMAYATAPWQLWHTLTAEQRAGIAAAHRGDGVYEEPWHRMLVIDDAGDKCVICPLCSRSYTTVPGLRYHVIHGRCPTARRPPPRAAAARDPSDDEAAGGATGANTSGGAGGGPRRGSGQSESRWLSSNMKWLAVAIEGTQAGWVLPAAEAAVIAESAARLRGIVAALVPVSDLPTVLHALRCLRSTTPLPAHVWRRHADGLAAVAFSALPRATTTLSAPLPGSVPPSSDAEAPEGRSVRAADVLARPLRIVDATLAPPPEAVTLDITLRPLPGPAWALDVLSLPWSDVPDGAAGGDDGRTSAALVAVGCHANPRLLHRVGVASRGRGSVHVWVAGSSPAGDRPCLLPSRPWLEIPHDGDGSLAVAWCPHATPRGGADVAVLAVAKLDGGVDVHAIPLGGIPAPGAEVVTHLVTSPPARTACRPGAASPAMCAKWSPLVPGELWVGYGDGVVGVFHVLDGSVAGRLCHPTHLCNAADARAGGLGAAVVALDPHPTLVGVCGIAMRDSVAIVDALAAGGPTATLLSCVQHRVGFTSVAWIHQGVNLVVGDALGNLTSVTCVHWRTAPLLVAASPLPRQDVASSACPVWDVCDATQQPAGAEALTLGDAFSAWQRSTTAAQQGSSCAFLLTAHGDGAVGLHAFLYAHDMGYFQPRVLLKAAARAAWRDVLRSQGGPAADAAGASGTSEGGSDGDSADDDDGGADSAAMPTVPLLNTANAALHGVTAFVCPPVPPIASPAGLPMLPLPLLAAHRVRMWTPGPRDGAGAPAAAVVFSAGAEGVLRAHTLNPRQLLSSSCGTARLRGTVQRMANAALHAARKSAGAASSELHRDADDLPAWG